jgi:hypothetical protein
MSRRKPDPWTDPAFEQAVRDTAYFLWEHDGRPHREQEYWFAALDRCLRQRDCDKALKRSLDGSGGAQPDDNIDELGRSAGDPKAPPLDQAGDA